MGIEEKMQRLRMRATSSKGSRPSDKDSVASHQIVARKPPVNKSRLNLKKAKEREQEKKRALAMTIDKAKREQEFDCLNKMAEACEIGKNKGISFSAYKGSDGSLKIHMTRPANQDEVMSE